MSVKKERKDLKEQTAAELDLPAVLDQFAAQAHGPKTAEFIRQKRPYTSRLQAAEDLSYAKEALQFLQDGGYFPLGGLRDITAQVKSAKKGFTLLPSELLDISLFLTACQQAASAFDPEKTPLLYQISRTLDPCRGLDAEINRCIDISGQIRPDATKTLENLHSDLARTKAAVSQAARAFIKAHGDDLMDTLTASVSSRVCVLVKANAKNKFGGIVQGSSQSGQAYYLEPQGLVELNNEVQNLQVQIEEEKKAICKNLSRKIKAKAKEILSNEQTMLVIDLAAAKAKWTILHDGTIPFLSTKDRSFTIEHAVHPLLDSESAVYNTYRLVPGQSALLISGANMGGKTVTLKTIGLFALLAQSGFPVSAHSAILPWYSSILSDIGDSQSIEYNLSTFSGHITKLGSILNCCDSDSLVLLDEIGNGTDPAEGASLAQAVIESLLDRKTTLITTTHYKDVKAFGKTDDRVLVSSVEFNPATLLPTYRYLEGVSGASYAFEIAEHLKIDKDVLKRARVLKEQRQYEADAMLEKLEKEQLALQKQKDRFDTLVKSAHELQRKADADQKKWEKKKKQLDSEYESQLELMLFEKKEEAKAIIRDLQKNTKKANHELIEQMKEIDRLAPEEKKKEAALKSEELKAGDYVTIEALNNHGEILSVNKNKAQVLVNGKKIRVSLDQCVKTKRPGGPQKSSRANYDRGFHAFPMELNIIGMRVEEGIRALDHYLDQAVVHRIKNVRIIHGMGTGALRKAVWDDLSKQSCVRSYASGGPSEGGLGATVVELK
jgi:DNA mismatch repair protein MutS2